MSAVWNPPAAGGGPPELQRSTIAALRPSACTGLAKGCASPSRASSSGWPRSRFWASRHPYDLQTPVGCHKHEWTVGVIISGFAHQPRRLISDHVHGGLRSSGRLHLRVRNIESRQFGCLPCVALPLRLLVPQSTLHDVGLTQTKVAKRRGIEEVSVRAVAKVRKVGTGGVGCDRLQCQCKI